MKPNKYILLSAMFVAALMAATPFAQAQQITGTPGSPERHDDHQTANNSRRPIRNLAA